MQFAFPSLTAYLRIAKTFQQSFNPFLHHSARPVLDQPTPAPAFKFATGFSAQHNLAQAVVECVAAVKQRLGPECRPSLLSLLVTVDPQGFVSFVSFVPPHHRKDGTIVAHLPVQVDPYGPSCHLAPAVWILWLLYLQLERVYKLLPINTCPGCSLYRSASMTTVSSLRWRLSAGLWRSGLPQEMALTL